MADADAPNSVTVVYIIPNDSVVITDGRQTGQPPGTITMLQKQFPVIRYPNLLQAASGTVCTFDGTDSGMWVERKKHRKNIAIVNLYRQVFETEFDAQCGYLSMKPPVLHPKDPFVIKVTYRSSSDSTVIVNGRQTGQPPGGGHPPRLINPRIGKGAKVEDGTPDNPYRFDATLSNLSANADDMRHKGAITRLYRTFFEAEFARQCKALNMKPV